MRHHDHVLGPTLVLSAYLLGGLPFGLWVGRLAKGVDVRTLGSGNIGATNVGRVCGSGWGVLVFGLDAAKGAGVAWAAQAYAPDWAAGVGLAAVLGHVFSWCLRFRGGKGVATACGVFGVLAPVPTGLATLGFATTLAISRVFGLSSLVATTVLVATCFALPNRMDVRILAAAVALVVFVRHAGNIRRGFSSPPSRDESDA